MTAKPIWLSQQAAEQSQFIRLSKITESADPLLLSYPQITMWADAVFPTIVVRGGKSAIYKNMIGCD